LEPPHFRVRPQGLMMMMFKTVQCRNMPQWNRMTGWGWIPRRFFPFSESQWTPPPPQHLLFWVWRWLFFFLGQR
jgi:hypothetical protein